MAKRKRRRKIRADQQKERKNGLAEGKIEIAKNLIAKGFEKNEIAEITELSIEEIENIIKENKNLT